MPKPDKPNKKPAAPGKGDAKDFQFNGAAQGKRFDLSRIDPAAKPLSSGDKAADKTAVDTLATELDTLQNLFYADRRYKLLVVLQGIDTAGKDGTIRGVFGQMSALGVHTIGWKAPSDEERAHDYLWRIHQQVPGCGEVTVFNRSHYEDVLVPVVNGWIDADETRRRYTQINDFERLLVDDGVVIVKIYLHISKDEQLFRFKRRESDPLKHWKISDEDWRNRKKWEEHNKAAEDMFEKTSLDIAPWHVIGANFKWHARVRSVKLVAEALESVKLRKIS